MKKCLILIVVLFLISCQPEINVIINKEPGRITGIVVPVDKAATVELYQGKLIGETTTDGSGFFEFDDVPPGTYRLIAKADLYGSVERSNIKVADGEGYDVGIIELIPVPNPLTSVYPSNGARSYSINSSYLRFTFNEYMLPESVEEALSITPEVEITEYYYPTESYGNYSYSYTFYGNFIHGTEYAYLLDTTAISGYGTSLEFPFTGTFTMEKFVINGIEFGYGSNSRLEIRFNGYVLEDEFEKIIFKPGTAIIMDNSYGYSYSPSRALREYSSTIFYIKPVTSWMTDTTYQVTISGDIAELGGITLGKDSIFTFETEPIQVTYTYPHNDQYYIGLLPDILVRFNNFIDEGTIEEALSVTPEAVYEIYSYRNDEYSYFYLNVTTGLQSKTEYNVEISTALTDIYGKHLKAPYSFRFVTQ